MSEELKPCPFCGGEAEIERYGTPRYSTIYSCTECGCRLETGETFNHGDTWNTRTEKEKQE
jgi:Lar family restriction alleviation protein